MLYMVTFTIHIPQNTPNVSIYTIHGSYGLYQPISFTVIRPSWLITEISRALSYMIPPNLMEQNQ